MTPACKAWRQALDVAFAGVAVPDGPLDGCLGLRLSFAMPRPKTLSGGRGDPGLLWCPRAGSLGGDWDNLGKMVTDRMERAGVVTNDARFVEVLVRKYYAAEGDPTGCRIVLRVLDAGPEIGVGPA